MFLATTSHRGFWDTDDELLFLGPWCTRYDRRHEWKHLKYRYLRNRWADRDRLDSDITYCMQVIEHAGEELGSWLNEVHAVSHGSRYWRVLLDLWLYYYVHDLYARYIHVREALEQFPKIRTRCLAQSCWFTPATTADHIAGYDGDRYPLQLYAQILSVFGRGMPAQAVEFQDGTASAARSAGASFRSKRLVRAWAAKWLEVVRAYIRADILLGDTHLGWRHAWALIWGTRFRVWPALTALPDDRVASLQRNVRREGLRDLKARDEFEHVLFSTFPSNFPTIFLEGYAAAREICRGMVKRPPKVFVASVGWWFNEYFKFVAAECLERGSRLVGFQHGGGYGFARASTAETLERDMADRWYAWGWASTAADPKVRDLPHPRLSELARRPSDARAERILYVSTEWPVSLHRLHNCPMEDQYEEYFTWRLEFIEALSDKVVEQLLVRLYPTDLGWSQAERLRAAMPNVRIDDSGTGFQDRLRQARLVVFDHPGTTFLEGLASGVPCVLFWKSEHWEVRAAAASYFARLREAGILFDLPKLAAEQVLRVNANPRRWWEAEPTRRAREAFVSHFALSDRDWLTAWIRELRAEAALAGDNCPEPTAGSGSGGGMR